MERDSLIYKLRRKGQVLASKVLPAEMLSKIYSRIVLKKNVDLKNPQTFNEKIQWCKIHYYPNNSLVVRCADKLAVREYVKEKGLGDILVPLYGSWRKSEEIEWEKLPEQFVLKCTHGCAYNILCPAKSSFHKEKAVRQLNQWLNEDFGAFNIERHYSKIDPHRIVCEAYLGACIMDYKFFCFNGVPKFVYVSNDMIHDRQAQIGFFDEEGKRISLKRDDYEEIGNIKISDFFSTMKKAAEILCADFPFVRVDFFLANGRYYFAELTFTPAGGMMPFNPDKCDLEWGNMLDIGEVMAEYGKK